tara:strand:- start:432 stop:584 length:153 start_codon:yes stop_codon:yes gene_type:complete
MLEEQFLIMIHAPKSGIWLQIKYMFPGIKNIQHFTVVKKSSCDVFFIRKK